MAHQTTYDLDDIRHEVSQLRAAANYALAMLDGIAAKVPNATVTVTESNESLSWPSCHKLPCTVGKTGLSRTGDVLRIRGRNMDNLLLALKNGPDGTNIEGAGFHPKSFPLPLPSGGIASIEDQPDPSPNA